MAMVQIIHNSASPTVDVYVNDGLAIEGFTYRSATGILELPTSFTVGIAPANDDVIANFDFNLEDGGSYVVVATGLLGNDDTPFDLAAAGTTFGASDNSSVGLEVYHGSTDAPAVDVLADGNVLVGDLPYSEFSGFVEVPAAEYVIGIAPAGGDVIAELPFDLVEDGSYVVVATGLLGDATTPFDLAATATTFGSSSNDVVGLKDLYLSFDVSNTTINMNKDVIASGEDVSGIVFTRDYYTSSYSNGDLERK